MAVIVYHSVPELARKIRLELSKDERRQLVRKLIKDDLSEFSEYQRDSIAYGNYAPISRICPTCKRPI